MQISERLFGNIYNIFKDMNILTEIQTVGTVANTCNPNKSKISNSHIWSQFGLHREFYTSQEIPSQRRNKTKYEKYIKEKDDL